MPAAILSIGTAVPATRMAQSEARDFFAAQPGIGRLGGRLIHAAFDQSAIDFRHTVIPDLYTAEGGIFLSPTTGMRRPTTGERNAYYRREAPPLFAAAASEALARAGVGAAEVTHVITASCTGFFAPGPDFRLVMDLGLPTSVERYHIGFMGCAAAFPALRAATRICDAQPGAVVLVACAELCTLHIRSSDVPDQIVASSVFADGAAAAVVTSDAARATNAHLEAAGFTTAITSEGENAMDWTIGDEGFEMVLTAEVPRIVGREIRAAVDAAGGSETADAWAVHPGGRSVLDRVQSGLDLPDSAMQTSRAVLREYGNMSSATILFILGRLLADPTLGDGARVMGLAFGPGLTVETARFTRRDAT
ncbi:type III polyketide synthase [Microbacterium rhizosphaerae]|uniref:Type III polyketide synthase n=1 Tax=Microbacterium rhizosphaerae TaxID=1678237 RepID=A0ABZ0SIB9_9MICO|nr:type III polyketide synthase [Microbacterium rhizosphaerae]WPR88495.1 type III polyketide synthase [Microbacterium rhizosphaerae]